MNEDEGRAKDRVVVTGIGLVTSIGIGRRDFWANLIAGQSGVSPVESFDTSAFSVHNGAEVKAFSPGKYVAGQDHATMGRASQLAIAAARLALEDGQVEIETLDKDRCGVVVGTTMGEQQEIERVVSSSVLGNFDVSPEVVMSRYPCHLIVSHVANEFGLAGANMAIGGACAAGNHALAYAFDAVRSGDAHLMLAGGTEGFSRVIFTGFARLGAIAPEICQPFDLGRRGMIPGEGAAILVLEPLRRALKRKALVYAEITGYGLSCDAHHITASHPEGEGAARAMERALSQSGLRPRDVGYISAHGTGTKTNDRLETIAIKRVFKETAYSIPVSSIKSMIGHTMGAASAIEAAACALAVRYDRIPPTINLQEPDPECDLDYVPNQAREWNVGVAINNAYGFGGNNASVVFAKTEVQR